MKLEAVQMWLDEWGGELHLASRHGEYWAVVDFRNYWDRFHFKGRTIEAAITGVLAHVEARVPKYPNPAGPQHIPASRGA